MIKSRYFRKFNVNTVYHQVKSSSTLIPWAVQNTFQSHQITKADKCYIYKDDKKFIDFTSGLMVVNLGHNNETIINGFKQHLGTGIAYTNSLFENGQREKLSERLVNVTDNLGGKVFYTNGGGDANETAVFIAHEYHKLCNNVDNKKRVLTFETSFHGGSTIGATLLSGDDRKSSKELYYSLPFESIMPNPSLIDDGKESLIQIQKLFDSNDIAAIIIEGSSGSAGCVPYPKGYLKQLESICKKNGILIICDEVMSGWGRTGKLFAYEKHSIKPDMVTTAKGFTSGYVQLGGVIMSKELASMYDNRLFVHGLTYFAHPLACTVANVCLDIYLDNDKEIIRHAGEKGILLHKLGKKIEADSSIVTNYRNNGLLGCIELNVMDNDILGNINNEIFDSGIYCFRRKNLIFTAPPLIITNEEIEHTMEIIHSILCADKYSV